MDMLVQLWLPTLLSAVAVWILAAMAWTVLPHHRGDSSKLPNEDGVLATLRGMNIPSGNYQFPRCEHGQHNDPEMKKKWEAGPTGMLSVWPANISMGKCMGLSFLVYLAVSVMVAYLGAMTLPAGASFLKVFQVMGTAGVLGYGFAHLPGGIWFQAYPRAMLMNVIDGVVFGLATGAIFAALWPAAA